jgi:hypothetical protein
MSAGKAHAGGRTALICQADEPLNRFGLARWLASFTDLAALIVVRDPKRRWWRRVRREIRRTGGLRFLDVAAFRLYYRVFLAARDRAWEKARWQELERKFGPLPGSTRILEVQTPNAPAVAQLLSETRPELMIARCKHILKAAIFSLPSRGTFVMHPGICPQYRNAHGCFWALARRDLDHVGLTLLKVDAGVDTGPVYGHYRGRFDERRESHVVIQHRAVFDNLDGLRARLLEILAGAAEPLDTTGLPSRAWGQPWLSAYWRWKRHARRAGRSATGA